MGWLDERDLAQGDLSWAIWGVDEELDGERPTQVRGRGSG